jgi:ABC-type lipoprotein export system ATPase subunit
MLTLEDLSVTALLATFPRVASFLSSISLTHTDQSVHVGEWLRNLSDDDISDAGMEPAQILEYLRRLVEDPDPFPGNERVDSLTIFGGQDKLGQTETTPPVIRAGEIVCVVGPTGSGKSRLLADIECLAQGDTPTGRRIWINGRPPSADQRFSPDRRLVAQLSQNMNFVVDLTVQEFVSLHAQCRMVERRDDVTAQVIACANELTGEKFNGDVSVTQLSGGQARALMIADAALLSASPIVLIDEIENAGVDRQRALALLVAEDKIVLISTHDPLLALRGGRRLVIRHGGIAEVIATSPAERRVLAQLERIDTTVMAIRDRLRHGLTIEEDLTWPT